MKKTILIAFGVIVCALIVLAVSFGLGFQVAKFSVTSPAIKTVAKTPVAVHTKIPTVIATSTKTLVRTPTPIAVSPTPTVVSNTYIVKDGDNLETIAKRMDVPLGYLADKNGIDNPNVIYVGQIITKPEWPPQPDTSGKQIIVELSTQHVFVYEKGELLKTFLVSTGTDDHPTVTGHFTIQIKLRYTDMDGPGYHLPNVEYTMYFFQGYGLHGTYWHHNFGHQMSHGCVNMYTPDAEWLFKWASVGTPVWVIK